MAFVQDNYSLVAGAVCAVLTMAMTGAGWMLCNYLKLQDSMEVAAHKTYPSWVLDSLLWKLYIVTLLVPAPCIFMGVFTGVRIENVFMRIEGLWDKAVFKAFAVFLGFYCGVFGLSVGVELSDVFCSMLATETMVQAVSENVPWWVVPMLRGLTPNNIGAIPVFIMLAILVGMTFFMARDTTDLQRELQNLWNQFHTQVPQCPSCGNVYADDSLFCRKCGQARFVEEVPQPPQQQGAICACGNVYADDSIFCRMCGAHRRIATPALPSMPSPTFNQMPSPTFNQMPSPTFNQLDINNDGFISRSEFGAYEQMMRPSEFKPSWSPTQDFLTERTVQGGARARASTPPPRFSMGY